jgi:hypothetical protein
VQLNRMDDDNYLHFYIAINSCVLINPTNFYSQVYSINYKLRITNSSPAAGWND